MLFFWDTKEVEYDDEGKIDRPLPYKMEIKKMADLNPRKWMAINAAVKSRSMPIQSLGNR